MFDPRPGNFVDSGTVTLTAAPGVSIYYRSDWLPISMGSWSLYTEPIHLPAQSLTEGQGYLIRAQAVRDFEGSAIAQAMYTVTRSQDATPTFSPPGGVYAVPQTVTISSSASDADIFFTLDGSDPHGVTSGSSIRYTGPIVVSSTTTIKAIAYAYYSETPIASATYSF